MPAAGAARTWCAAALLAAAAACAAGTSELTGSGSLDERIPLAVLPFQGAVAGVDDLAAARSTLVEGLRATGRFRLLPEAGIESSLAAHRIRVVETLPSEAVEVLLADLDHPFLLTGTALYVDDRFEPTAAILLRAYDPAGRRLGSRLWALRAADAADAFALGAPETLADLWAGPAREWVEQAVDLIEAPARGDRPRVGVLPFDPAPDHPESGRLAALVAGHLLEEEFGAEVAEPGDLLNAFVAARVRSLEYFGTEQARELAGNTGARWLLAGSVLEIDYGNGPGQPPKVSLTMRLFDAESGRSIVSGLADRSGDEGEVVFGIGQNFHPVTNLAAALRRAFEDMNLPWARS